MGLFAKDCLFLAFAILFLVTGVHKLIGIALRVALGWAGVIVGLVLAIVVCWYVIKWLISCL